jgi:type VI secretion system secreted protein Hcp
MAVDIFLKIDGIPGESQDAKHKDEIDVLSWSWGMSTAPTAGLPTGQVPGRVSVKDMSITKRIDVATPRLMLSCASGQHLRSAALTVRKAGAKQPEFLNIKMNEVLVTSVTAAESSAEDRGTELLTLAFSKVGLDYVQQKADGTAAGTVSFNWDLVKNVKG